jgi:hypothetical protein
MVQTQIVYAKPPADGALPDPAGTFDVVHTPFDTEATNLRAGEVLVESVSLDRSVPSLRFVRSGGHALPVHGDQAGDHHFHVPDFTRGAVGQPY